jgi:GTP-binding protein
VAFAGRSNAGKSSAINALCDQKGLARTSKTPGRTQMLNFFRVDDHRRLVDLPGYGYARVAEGVKQQWQALMADYLSRRRSLRGVVLVMDVRHPLTESDGHLLEWCAARQLPVHALVTKADKLKRGPALEQLRRVEAGLRGRQGRTSAQLFSALKREGLERAHAVLEAWLGLAAADPRDAGGRALEGSPQIEEQT